MSRETMNSAIVAILAVAVAIFIAATSFGQTADEPWRYDEQPPVMRAVVPMSDDLQEVLDGPEQIIDCGGKVFHVTQAIICSVKHHGKVLKNCDIYFEGDPGNIVAWWLFIQNRSVGGIYYYPGVIDFTWENVRMYGDFCPPTVSQEINEHLADQTGKGVNIISNYTYRAGTLTFKTVEIHNSGNSAIAIAADGLAFENFKAFNISKHGIGARGVGGTQVTGTDIYLENCGGSIDFHNDGNFFNQDKPDVANIERLTIKKGRGRNKIAGINWEVTGKTWVIEKDTTQDTNTWSAFDCSRRPRKLDIDGLVVSNFVNIGLRFGPDTFNAGSPLSIKNATINNSMYALMLQQSGTAFSNVAVQNYRNLWVSGSPSLAVNLTGSLKQNDLYWAQQLDGCERKMAELNAEHGTTFDLNYSAPASVIRLMETR